jgi:hypothetical protein
VFVSHKYKVIFVHIQRTGGNSVYRAFESHDSALQIKLPFPPELKRLKHSLVTDIKAVLDAEIFQNYTKFCTVRNPYDRMVSWYSMFKHKTMEKLVTIEEFPELVKLREAVEQEIENQVDTFEDFVGLPKNHPSGLFARFYVPQLAFISDKDGRILVDRILHFENLSEDFAQFARDIGFEGMIPHSNRSIRERSYRGYYTDALQQEIQHRFKDDFEYFGYRF